ncbi:hypothetical protein Tco_0487823 [Tanacetum coccineum]
MHGPRCRAHLNYVKHLKESVETVREIVEEARVVKPLDSSLNYACQYTKLSQELLECVIGTCPKSFNERDNKAPSTPVTRKKQVTFSDAPGTSSSNTQKHEVHQKVQQTNVHVIHSTGVNTSTEASGSKPRGNTKKNRIPPAKTENKKKVEVHPRTNKSVWTKVNRVDSSISSKRVVINSNSESVCKTCNKCLNSANHEMCVVNILSSVNATPTVKIVLNKGKQIWKPKGKLSDNSLNKTKQIWKPKGKLSDNSLNKTKQVWKATGKLFANVGYQWRSTGKKVALGKLNCGYQWRPTGKKFTLGKLNCGYQWRPTGKKFALGELCPLTRLPVTCGTDHPSVSGLKLFKTQFRGRNEWLLSSLGLHCQMMFGQNSSSLTTRKLPVVEVKRKGSATDVQAAKSLLELHKPKKQHAESGGNSEKINSETDTEILNVSDEQGADWKVLSCLGSSKEAKEPNLQISMDTLHNTNFFRALTASADIPSSVSETTDTTSTLQPPPPPLQKPTVHRDICYERSHKGVKASANSDIIFFFTSAQDGNRLLDDERLRLDDDLKKANDHNQNKSK